MPAVFVDVEVNERRAGSVAGGSHGPGAAALLVPLNKHGNLSPSRTRAGLPDFGFLPVVDSFRNQATVEGGGEAAACRILGIVPELPSQSGPRGRELTVWGRLPP